MNNLKNNFILLAGVFFVLLTPAVTLAQTHPTIGDAGTLVEQTRVPTGLPSADAQTLAGTLISAALTIVGVVFFILMLYGGFLWMTARGNEDQVDRSKQIIIASMIGIIVIVGAYAITQFIITAVVNSAK